MFSDERVVEVRTRGNGVTAFFVDQSRVNESKGEVEVQIVSREDGAWAILPTPNRDAIPVDEELISR